MSGVSLLKDKRFLITAPFCAYISFKLSVASSFFARILFLITSSTLEEESEILMLNLPWILEKSLLFTFLETVSIASWLVTNTQARPPHSTPSLSTIVWRFNINPESLPMYWPISSIIKITLWFLPLLSIYSLTLIANWSILKLKLLSAFWYVFLAASSVILFVFERASTILSSSK